MKRREYKQENELFEFAHGFESTIHKYISDDGEDVVFKKFKNQSNQDLTKMIARNKEQKLEIISSLNNPNLVQIKELLYKNGMLVGYTMPMVKGKQLDLFSKVEDKLEELRQLRKYMLELNNQGIYIGDYHEHNFILTDDGNVICLDLDNYKIYAFGMKLDFDTKYLRTINRFRQRCNNDELIDRYCYNMQIICLLGRYDIARFNLCWLNRLPNSIINSNHNRGVIEEMIRLGNDYPGNLLELKRRN